MCSRVKKEICLAQEEKKKNTLSMAAYYTKLKGHWDELAAYS